MAEIPQHDLEVVVAALMAVSLGADATAPEYVVLERLAALLPASSTHRLCRMAIRMQYRVMGAPGV